VISGIDDAVIGAEQFLSRVLGDVAELVVDVGDDTAVVGRRDDRRLVERISELIEA
jgi:hypothetical protein